MYTQYVINFHQKACVRNVMDSVMDSLRRDPNRKFVFAEMVKTYAIMLLLIKLN